MMTIERKVVFQTSHRDRNRGTDARRTTGLQARVPRVAKLMALAIRLDQLIRDGQVADRAEAARLGHVTRARLTQIMNLLHLAPDLQEQILLLPSIERGRAQFTEKQLRPIAATPCWKQQRRMWLNGFKVS
ncbi:hypothetical protein ETAA8_40510 [Anatilimnocola aggregata]|uniref:Uncharacterized protein n=1 Tax=Anatilimnocola aggregata TaxID=2528021 RepID=A0A517YFD5_9BACT|nr:hypothetical protein [Anatilimnocola aggregata]QDU28945.1 hypothetical protein ETAA8_40510 [Anatilimnocola aggregata]